ncbi:hypothetical protein N7508_008846 [Penicillium antarcticum]|uniref:uncharacterized protein n=1 Tax=Penicillium antarcticum TaxID=416450 RepID=UPI002391271D|nr:uncharacterized protein N7508_008846 [Penicillium antarcticum]KAJ5294025.1 hypothetical protein N7508_008846 [Penicillium antarcticum]
MTTTITIASGTTPASNIPLTTVFTPPASCDNFSWISSDCLGTTCRGVYNIVRATETECYPSGWASSATTFSPGLVCPSGYSIAATTLASYGVASIETRATCCPSGFTIATESPLAWYTPEPCIRTTDVATTITFTVVGVTPATTTAYTWTTPIYHAMPVGIAWQSSDTISTSVDVTPTATSETNPATTNSASATTSAASSSGGSSSGLSTGAKAGIGVGVSVGVIAIALAIGAIFWLRRRKSSNSHQQVSSGYGSTAKTPSHGVPTELEVMSSTSGATELPAEGPRLHELKG